MSRMPGQLTDRIEDRVLTFVRAHRIFEQGQSVLVGVSGGADSLCLLHVLLALRDQLDIRLHVAHLDHMLRGSDSTEDSGFVTSHARCMGLNCTTEARDVETFRKQHSCSLEEAAREVRYAFLSDVARDNGLQVTAVGHTRDDSVETIMLHLLRGSGIHGLRGLDPIARISTVAMSKQNRNEGLLLARPLLTLSSEETRQYCHAKGLQPRLDSSNESVSFLRNRIRLELLPECRKLNPRMDDAIMRLSRAAREDDEYLTSATMAVWQEIASESSEGISIDLRGFTSAAPALQSRVVREAIVRLNGSARDVGMEHLTAVRELAMKPAGKAVDLPGGIIWRRDYSALIASRVAMAATTPCAPSPLAPITIPVPGEILLPGWKVTTELRESQSAPHPTGLTAHLDADNAATPLTVRGRRQGDTFRPIGMSEDKKLQDFMVDAHIPATQRDAVPLLCSAGQIAWVVGWRIGDRVKVTPETRTVLRVHFIPRQDGTSLSPTE
ncbi:MAG: tRNA lysidine(34) synthetase TilS [Dehalococcoidia bacterium]|nr:tRNA lysidine(34) synthetase TilS [Dehalococcoidia bacterium]